MHNKHWYLYVDADNNYSIMLYKSEVGYESYPISEEVALAIESDFEEEITEVPF